MILTLSLSAKNDESRAKEIENINKSDGVEYIAGSRRPIKLENGIHYHGWLYNKDIDCAVIQYTYPLRLGDSNKKKIAENLLSEWKGELGVRFRKAGFKDVALMLTENYKTKVYSSKYARWYTVDEYLKLSF
jgi:hypothetical protein